MSYSLKEYHINPWFNSMTNANGFVMGRVRSLETFFALHGCNDFPRE